MEPAYNFAQDDYARAIMMRAAIAGDGPASSAYDDMRTADLLGPIRQISNHRMDHQMDHPNFSHPNGNTKPGASGTSNGYNPPFPASLSMVPAMVSPANGGSHGNNQFRGIGAEISRNYSDNLGILNAETYDAGDAISRSLGKRNKDASKPMIFGFSRAAGTDSEEAELKNDEYLEPEGTTRRRKKPRIENHSADEEEDGRKKVRGRPRVDAKDETAADRRRTQIRLAQRAYRHRKETTISSLEKKVQELRGTNEEMSNIFITLYDFAVARGLLQREPEFGKQLQSTTERFLALAKASSEYASQEENYLEEPEKQNGAGDDSLPTTKKKKGARKSPKSRPEVAPPIHASPPLEEAQISESNDPIQEISTDYYSQNYGDLTGQEEHQIITRPTTENASFPFDFMDFQQYRVDVPSMEDFSQYFIPESQPPLPRTHADTELTFARRLQRQAAERALQLIHSPHLTEEVFRRVFGFSGSYESRDSIAARLKGVTVASATDCLNNWRAPFVNVGGSGTFYPTPENGANQELMPKHGTGFSMGPFSSPVAQVQEILDENMCVDLPGFKGEFFDPNDVEGYLRERGLDIPPSADVVTFQVDFSLLSELSSRGTSSGSITTTMSPRTPRSANESTTIELGNVEEPYSLDVDRLDGDAYPFPLVDPKQYLDTKGDSNIEPSFLTTADQTLAASIPDVLSSENQLQEKSTIIVNVETLLFELTRRAICLGRSPGIRPSDVNAAIVAAARAGHAI